MRSWVFFHSLFYQTLFYSLAASLTINIAIKPVSSESNLALPRWQTYPSRPGYFAITHLEHWHDGWPDYSDGLIVALSLKVGGFIEKFISYDEVECLIFVGFLVAIVVAISLNT